MPSSTPRQPISDSATPSPEGAIDRQRLSSSGTMGDNDHSFADGLQAAPQDGRGHYDRSGGKGVRLAWIPYVQRHMDAISRGDLSVCSRPCAKNCPQGGKCLENVGLLRVLKVCAAESFGFLW